MISALGILLNGLIFMILQVGDPEVYITSLNSIVHAEGVLGAFLGIVEVFSIWSLIITGIGLQVVAKFSKGLSWSIVVAFLHRRCRICDGKCGIRKCIWGLSDEEKMDRYRRHKHFSIAYWN